MRRAIAAAVLTLFCAGFAYAADETVVVLPAKNGNVTFPHKQHKDMPEMKCTNCHETDKGGKIADLGKDWAHKTCKGCHTEKAKGPTKCNECHKK
ncbi:cytochrome c family protein [Geomonas subterranea]|uniref:Cytochrome c family protein n=1 Tax=Geomonas subterranea TaxID=2847989 RepID=A0ABX8LDE8_9BACT|nr:cytochrome c7 [Geomonas subterranea]QXE90065.1 cytochrome c family protein [Geomonas subterranea]QXM07813.1 cytochrome c family protein [Geomonas subterranea]